jgi:ATP-dependent Clp protease, protease subunit
MNMELKNQTNQRRNRSYYFDKENPSRTIILSGEVDDNTVYDLIEMICDINEYDDENEDNVRDYERKPIKMIVNSFGGSVYDGFALIGVMENSKTPIHTYCYGSAMSMALLIMVSGHKRFGHRLSTFMYHECLDNLPYDKLTTLKENLEETKRIMKVYDDQLLSKTKLKRKQVEDIKKIKLDWYMSPEEALSYKIIDQII